MRGGLKNGSRIQAVSVTILAGAAGLFGVRAHPQSWCQVPTLVRCTSRRFGLLTHQSWMSLLVGFSLSFLTCTTCTRACSEMCVVSQRVTKTSSHLLPHLRMSYGPGPVVGNFGDLHSEGDANNGDQWPQMTTDDHSLTGRGRREKAERS